MFEKIVPVNKERHGQQRVKEISSFSFAEQFHIAYVTMHEFARTAATYPIVFLEDKAKGSHRPVALLGLDAGTNLFVGDNGQWNAPYIPAIIRRYPFALATSSKEGQYTVCIDEGSNLLSTSEGLPLFAADGTPGPVMDGVKRYLTELQQMDQLTGEFSHFLVENQLLTPLNLRVREQERDKNINGCFVVNEERLKALSDEAFKTLRTKNYLPAIYAQLISLAQVDRLVALSEKRQAQALAH